MTIEDYMGYKLIATLIGCVVVWVWIAYRKWKDKDNWPKL